MDDVDATTRDASARAPQVFVENSWNRCCRPIIVVEKAFSCNCCSPPIGELRNLRSALRRIVAFWRRDVRILNFLASPKRSSVRRCRPEPRGPGRGVWRRSFRGAGVFEAPEFSRRRSFRGAGVGFFGVGRPFAASLKASRDSRSIAARFWRRCAPPTCGTYVWRWRFTELSYFESAFFWSKGFCGGRSLIWLRSSWPGSEAPAWMRVRCFPGVVEEVGCHH